MVLHILRHPFQYCFNSTRTNTILNTGKKFIGFPTRWFWQSMKGRLSFTPAHPPFIYLDS
jgi:hypothetical protein